MDGKKKPTAATGSSIVDDLFGPKDGAASSSAGYFSTVFPTPSGASRKRETRRSRKNQAQQPSPPPPTPPPDACFLFFLEQAGHLP
ncbi:hypothetical protein TRIUR3_28986 [Triticum urartu]|uniref:Uncharacterized protein n=2 Tax=Triticum TaxID=4564 RepID=A0A9R1NTB5_TRITD|nr:hypothetical protein TRIUR3_28986 [Triticum urartu]VAH30763.1 unnamed protein product [Triticum turgidum subsp. durum]